MTVTAATLKGPEATISDASLEELGMTIRGEVLTPRDAGYATVRPAFNAMYPGRPRSSSEPRASPT